MKTYLFIVILLLPSLFFSQEKMEGMIMEARGENNTVGLPGANVYWLNSQIGTVTNGKGLFSIAYKRNMTSWS